MLTTRVNLRALCAKSKLLSRSFASQVQSPVEPQLTRTKDNSTIISWHKPADFPYECTKPLLEQTATSSSDTVLKTQMSPELLNVFNKKAPELARLELMNITHTTKHRWFPRARDKRAKKTPMDRQYL